MRRQQLESNVYGSCIFCFALFAGLERRFFPPATWNLECKQIVVCHNDALSFLRNQKRQIKLNTNCTRNALL